MLTIGLSGGVASGKSLVARLLAERGAEVLDADAAGHTVLEYPEVKAALAARWGTRVLNAAGKIDRPTVGRIVFEPTPGGREELAFLEGLSHPRIGNLLEDQRTAAAARNAPAVVLDAPIMFKAGWDRLCDVLIFVDAPLPLRRERALTRGWDEAELDRRESLQLPLAEKRARSQVVIDNSGPISAIRPQVERFWREWVERPDKDSE